MTRILRHEVPVDGQWHTITGCGMPLHVGSRNLAIVEFWAWELPHPDSEIQREFCVVGTGQPIDQCDVWYAGTTITPGGHLVWHPLGRTAREGDTHG